MSRDTRIEGLELWVIYDHPRDYPHYWVARRHTLYRDEVVIDVAVFKAQSLGALRQLLPGGLTRLPRDILDDRAIAEVWL
jgi:hypothetical protein